jgi:hypothetical protein
MHSTLPLAHNPQGSPTNPKLHLPPRHGLGGFNDQSEGSTGISSGAAATSLGCIGPRYAKISDRPPVSLSVIGEKSRIRCSSPMSISLVYRLDWPLPQIRYLTALTVCTPPREVSVEKHRESDVRRSSY